jgi:hypothetical protein
MALLDGDGEVFRPAAAEIDVIALNHCETTPNLEDPGRILGISHHIVRVGPKAKTGRAGALFRAQKCGSAAFIADISRKSGLSLREQSLLDGLPGFCGLQRGQSHHSAVAVGVGPIFARNISRPETRGFQRRPGKSGTSMPPSRTSRPSAGCSRRPRFAPVQCRLWPVCSRIDRPPAPQPRGAAPVQWRWQRDGSLNRSRTPP